MMEMKTTTMLKVLLLTVLLGLALANSFKCVRNNNTNVISKQFIVLFVKVQLIGNGTNSVEMARNEDEILKSHAKKRGLYIFTRHNNAAHIYATIIFLDDNDDPNSVNCIDPVLRSDIATALQKVTEKSCKILLFNELIV
uniref:Cystatin domain-containing protein n=1 Tax=Heterorhabditis bacteriophora TaxID=37862 RepID=A0A1I7WKA0_HETBA